MAILTPGIHENLVFSSDSQINDKGTLELVMKQNDTADALMSAFEEDTTSDNASSKFLFFPISMLTFEGAPKTAAAIAQELLQLRSQLLTYAMLIGTKEEASKAFGGTQMFQNIGIAASDIKATIDRLDNEELAKKVHSNLCSKFLAYMQSKDEFTSTPFRHKFWRKSKDKNFPSLPSSKSRDVFVESMLIPKEASKIGWSEWEIKNKKNDPTPAQSDAVDAPSIEEEEGMFGAPATVESEDTTGDSLI